MMKILKKIIIISLKEIINDIALFLIFDYGKKTISLILLVIRMENLSSGTRMGKRFQKEYINPEKNGVAILEMFTT